MYPLSKNEDIEKQKTIVEKVYPKISLKAGGVFDAFIENLLGKVKRKLFPLGELLLLNFQFGEKNSIKVTNVLHRAYDHFGNIVGARNWLIVVKKRAADQAFGKQYFHFIFFVPVFLIWIV